MNVALFALIFVSVSLNALAQIVLRKAMLVAGVLPPLMTKPLAFALALASNGWLWAGMACYATSIGLWLSVLSRVQVSVAYPMLSMGYVIAAVLGAIFLGEPVGAARMAGISLVCLGVFFIARTA
jgi:drug/metabolite transporter (DMT)-like permease